MVVGYLGVYKLTELRKTFCVRFMFDMCLAIRAVIIAKGSGRSRGTKVNGNYSEEDEAGYTENYLLPRGSLASGAFKALLPTELVMPGVEGQKRNKNQDSKNVGTDVLLGGFENARQPRLSLPRLKLGGISSQTGLSNDGGAIIERENGRDTTNADIEDEKREIFTSGILIRAQSSPVAGLVAKNGTSKGGDHFSFVPPTRLVRSLSSLSNPESARGSLLEQDMKLSQDDLVRSINADATELDAETSSEAGWSVRDNPMASEESYPSDSSDEDMDHRSQGEDFPRLRKVGSVDSSPREIHMIISEPKSRRSFDDPSGRTRKPEQANDIDHIYPCANGISNLLHKDEMIQDKVCPNCACQHCESNATGRYQDAAGESGSPPAKEMQNQGDQGLRRFSPFRMVTRHWRTLRWCAEAALGGSLFLVLAAAVSVAVPAVFVGKALNGSREYESLVPT